MRPVRAALFHADGQTYRRVEANSRFWQNSANAAVLASFVNAPKNRYNFGYFAFIFE